ncbi:MULTISPECIES: CHASE3 domain-containing protein [unclassified Acidovorax]|jgi:signal transduction histidine kinase|uniref:sensor histidine kinase n=1 Tax=unclassified Acidovorax TaxID=2684926 RepID=UPI000BC8D96E|nr:MULTISPECIES: CHASE3 domain-containing protein [unclassified Acidovorax]OZA58435.1 MAG: histidine kinase [Acidovorax sp. 17-64-282]HQS21201.1 CHASE3 domain-containing protein [Acidovorax defluvii]OYY29603.1 MAG: histidine kinase [Acidovorax sp. 35-64-16]OYY85464.1 MAG: histidine kinase [Acidovorax sp. 28-64-14]OYZ46521.1 MAG: histidine kinase [Acidovorax sp. 16-64-162]
MTLKDHSWHWLRKSRSMAISLPFALLAALLLIGINEVGHKRSQDAVQAMSHGQQTRNAANRLLQSMLDAETGQRGYLLTGNEGYLEPYDKAVITVKTNLEELHTQYLHSTEDLQQFALLALAVSRKLAEMELSLRLRRQGNEDAWKFILFTDVGREHMDSIRQLAHTLIERSSRKIQEHQSQIVQSLMLSRIGIATVTAIGLLAFYMYLRQARTLQQISQREQDVLEHERERLEGLVRERTASLSELASHLQQVREDERGYLARELHDELGALLTSAKLDVARLKSKIDHQAPDIAERLKHLNETLNSGIALKRRIIEDLRPSSLSNLGLTAALEILTREHAEGAGIEVETNLEAVELTEATQLTVYRLVQEALTNISKYAKAKKVLVTVHGYPTHAAVQVRDDGAGFDPAGVGPTSHGLAGMRHRVEAAGGRLTITSSPDSGTLISAVLPKPR